jgi:hypothetical protein
MPSSILLNGRRIYSPGVKAEINTDALGGRGTSVGAVALVADLPGFQQSTPQQFTSARALADYDPASDDLKLIGKLAFDPFADDAVPGGASSLWVVSTATSTQAFADLLDTLGGQAMVLKSRVWGLTGNRLNYDVSKTGTVHTLTFLRDGITEEIEIDTPAMGTIQYTGGVLTLAVVQINNTQTRLEWTRLLGAVHPIAEATDWDHAPCAGVVTVSADVNASAGETLDVTITGTDLAGAPQAEVVQITDVSALSIPTVASFGSITSVASLLSGGALTPAVTVGCDNGRLIPHTGRKVSGVLTEIGQINGWATATLDPTAASTDAADLDATNGEVSALALLTLTSDVAQLVSGLAVSQLVEAERGTSLLPVDLSSDQSGNMLGGSEASPVGTTDWQAALDTIKDQDVQIVVPLSTDGAVHGLMSKHCTDSALQGYERNAWVGTVGNQTKAQVKAAAAALNTRYVALVGDQIEVDHPNGTTPTLEPSYLALMMGAGQAGSPIAWPLTNNRPRVRDVFQTWGANIDAEEMIAAGVVILRKDNLGWKVARSVTTYLTDDNPILSEVSAWESVQTSVRDLRSALITRIGNPAIAGTAGRIKAAASSRLDEQVRLGWIKAWRNMSVDDLGDTFRINYEAAAVEPINFIVLAASVVRIPGA